MGKLGRGDAAPDFSAESVNMGTINLRDNRGGDVLLIFSRYFGCPICQLEFDELLEYKKMRPGLRVIYVNQSLPGSARAYIEGRGVDFPVVAAEKRGDGYPLYDLYGVGGFGPHAVIDVLLKSRRARAAGKRHGPYEGIETQCPAQFLVDAEGRIVSAHYGFFDTGKLPDSLGK
jgi:peroxiredoxin Q/BCP